MIFSTIAIKVAAAVGEALSPRFCNEVTDYVLVYNSQIGEVPFQIYHQLNNKGATQSLRVQISGDFDEDTVRLLDFLIEESKILINPKIHLDVQPFTTHNYWVYWFVRLYIWLNSEDRYGLKPIEITAIKNP